MFSVTIEAYAIVLATDTLKKKQTRHISYKNMNVESMQNEHVKRCIDHK